MFADLTDAQVQISQITGKIHGDNLKNGSEECSVGVLWSVWAARGRIPAMCTFF